MRASKILRATPLALAILLAGCATTQAGDSVAPVRAADAAAPQAAAPQTQAAWAHQQSDVAADQAVRFGILPNGMRYALMRNATPPVNAALRLRIDAGSLHEREDQRGIAHYIEHLALNETRNVPEGELVRILERAGLRFGPDTNASTSFDQTVYMLDLPRTDDQIVDTGLMLMREVAGEATLSQRVIDSERGIILSEERSRATPQLRQAEDELAYLFTGDLLGKRMPIGTTEVIRTAPRERFVEFYDGYYRPERATLIAVGDFDVDAMEAKIRSRFGDWQGRGAPAAPPPPIQVPPREVETRVLVEPGVPTRVSMTWVSPRDPDPDNRAERAERLKRQLALTILNRRLERIATSADAPLIGGQAVEVRLADRAEITQIAGVAQAGGWERALQTIEQEQRRALEHGFTQAELDREIATMRSQLTAAVNGAATRASPQLAMGIVNAVNEDRVFAAPATRLQLFEEAAAGLTSQQVGAAFREAFRGSGPLVYLTSPQAIPNGEAALRTAFAASRQAAVAAPVVQQATTWPYSQFGTAGQVAERRELAEIGATAIRFANGVRLTVKPTQFADNQVLVSARFAGGQLALPTDRVGPAWGIAAGGFVGGGLGQLSFEDLQQVLAGKVYSADANIAEDAITLSGTTRPEDLATQLQVLTAFARDPGFRASGWDRLRSLAGTIHDQFETTAQGVFGRDSGALLRSGDRRWEVPSRQAMTETQVTALRELMVPALSAAPLEVIVVGDITVDEAVRQVAATFGALPARQSTAGGSAPPVRFPAAGSVTRTHKGRADQAMGFIAWPTDDTYDDLRRTRTLNLLSRVMQLRLTEQIREAQGTSYSPQAVHSTSDHAAGYGYMAAVLEAPPQALEGFFRDAEGIARSLREQPISADELERARRPMVEQMQRARNSSNQFWVSELAGLHARPGRAATILTGPAQVSAVTPAELQQAARQYLVDSKAWRMSVVPETR
jgi:zinc protease